ncbi:hypothetical protein QBC35DRAFT_119383 [Podospora australis]|uniref:Autophagy-related protein 28 n=1 Tax=Podospora australis TaxID=1536484 RepID=A0AAN7ADL6_9PEZI|nr:hypothetical protein QBC35DRAFT_119383 [Podospora australis]
MSSASSFLPRLSLSRNTGPVLPFHNQPGSTVRKQPSEYDLSDLSPRAEDDLLSPETWRNQKSASSSDHRTSSPTHSSSTRASSNAGSASKVKSNNRLLFTGPPPPIVSSRIHYRDEEEPQTPAHPFEAATSIARNVGSVFFDRNASRPSHTRSSPDSEPDAVWRNLQHRERALQKELQHLLDAQSSGLAAGLAPPPGLSTTNSEVDGTSTPTGLSQSIYTDAASTISTSTKASRRVAFSQANLAATGEVIPVRQPKHKPITLRAARAGLARQITLLADLKSEEDATLTTALATRKKALAQLRKLAAQQEEISEELRVLEEDKDEPLAKELRELTQERSDIKKEIVELEERLVELRNRKRFLDAKVGDIWNRREAGLSGYRGALKDVEGRLEGILSRPGVRPLDLEAINPQPPPTPYDNDGGGEEGQISQPISLGGSEFLRLRPERRTPEMAREWWEGEIAILEKRKAEVDKDRLALEEGVEVWKAAVRVVNDFEAGMHKEMMNSIHPDVTGTTLSPEEAMGTQFGKMGSVMAALEEQLRTAEDKGWNLLICAIGAELEAFKLGRDMLQDMLRDAGMEVGNDDDGQETPHLGRSALLDETAGQQHQQSRQLNDGQKTTKMTHDNDDNSNNLVDLHAEESDNEVPQDLLVSTHEPDPKLRRMVSKESTESENEVPPEFLAEHF